MDPNKLVPNSHKPSPSSKPKPPAPPAVTAMKNNLHPMSKTVQAIVGNNRKKGS
jgi:hypothetical protein